MPLPDFEDVQGILQSIAARQLAAQCQMVALLVSARSSILHNFHLRRIHEIKHMGEVFGKKDLFDKGC